MKEYKIITAPDPDCLEEVVNSEIAEGWEPLGGVSVSLSESEEYRYERYAQAMTKDG